MRWALHGNSIPSHDTGHILGRCIGVCGRNADHAMCFIRSRTLASKSLTYVVLFFLSNK